MHPNRKYPNYCILRSELCRSVQGFNDSILTLRLITFKFQVPGSLRSSTRDNILDLMKIFHDDKSNQQALFEVSLLVLGFATFSLPILDLLDSSSRKTLC